MGATVVFSESNDVAGESVTDDIANLNFGNVDDHELSPVSSYPITANENSYEKYLRVKFSGTYTTISNMKYWKSAGNYKTGETIKIRVTNTWVVPVATDTGGALIGTDEPGSTVIHASDGVALTITGPGDNYTEYVVQQLQTTAATPAGAVNQKTLLFQWDEV